MTLGYLVRRLLLFVVVVWGATRFISFCHASRPAASPIRRSGWTMRR